MCEVDDGRLLASRHRIESILCTVIVLRIEHRAGVGGGGLRGIRYRVVDVEAGGEPAGQCARRQSEAALLDEQRAPVLVQVEVDVGRVLARRNAAQPGIGHLRDHFGGAHKGPPRVILVPIGLLAVDPDPRGQHPRVKDVARL